MKIETFKSKVFVSYKASATGHSEISVSSKLTNFVIRATASVNAAGTSISAGSERCQAATDFFSKRGKRRSKVKVWIVFIHR